MYIRASKLQNLPVVSLQSGDAIAQIHQPVIAMEHLHIVAFECRSPQHADAVILTVSDIRQLAPDCIIVDSEADLAEADDIVRLQSIIHQHYTPLESSVVTESGHHLGNVDDYIINLDTSRIQQLYVQPPFWRFWLRTSHTIDQSQVVDISATQIIVRDTFVKHAALQTEPLPEINP